MLIEENSGACWVRLKKQLHHRIKMAKYLEEFHALALNFTVARFQKKKDTALFY